MEKFKHIIIAISLFTIPISSYAATQPLDDFVSISAYLGGRYSDDLKDTDSGENANIDTSFAQALAISWYYDRNSEGELFYSNSKQNLNISDESTEIYTSYLHFGGRINFVNKTPFSTSLGLGLGATFFLPDESEYKNDIALSGSISGGVRYQLNEQWALKADLRVYATVLQNDSSLFCSNNKCLIELDGQVYVQTDLLAGVEYKF